MDRWMDGWVGGWVGGWVEATTGRMSIDRSIFRSRLTTPNNAAPTSIQHSRVFFNPSDLKTLRPLQQSMETSLLLHYLRAHSPDGGRMWVTMSAFHAISFPTISAPTALYISSPNVDAAPAPTTGPEARSDELSTDSGLQRRAPERERLLGHADHHILVLPIHTPNRPALQRSSASEGAGGIPAPEVTGARGPKASGEFEHRSWSGPRTGTGTVRCSFDTPHLAAPESPKITFKQTQ